MPLQLYDAIEEMVRAEIVTHVDELDDDFVIRGDLDSLIDNIFEKDGEIGVYVDFMGGRRSYPSEEFKSRMWVWVVMVMVLVRFTPTIEDDLRRIIGKFATLFGESHTINGQVVRAEVTTIDQPEPGTVNDVPFYWMPVIVNVWDRP